MHAHGPTPLRERPGVDFPRRPRDAQMHFPRPEAWGFSRPARGLPHPDDPRRPKLRVAAASHPGSHPGQGVPRGTPRPGWRTTTKTKAPKAPLSVAALRPSAIDVDVLGFRQEQEPRTK